MRAGSIQPAESEWNAGAPSNQYHPAAVRDADQKTASRLKASEKLITLAPGIDCGESAAALRTAGYQRGVSGAFPCSALVGEPWIDW